MQFLIHIPKQKMIDAKISIKKKQNKNCRAVLAQLEKTKKVGLCTI